MSPIAAALAWETQPDNRERGALNMQEQPTKSATMSCIEREPEEAIFAGRSFDSGANAGGYNNFNLMYWVEPRCHQMGVQQWCRQAPAQAQPCDLLPQSQTRAHIFKRTAPVVRTTGQWCALTRQQLLQKETPYLVQPLDVARPDDSGNDRSDGKPVVSGDGLPVHFERQQDVALRVHGHASRDGRAVARGEVTVEP